MISFLSTQNLMLAYQNACKSRKNKKEVYIFNQDLEKNLKSILDDLTWKTYIHGGYQKFVLTDNKKRYIYSPTFRDHILHHMLYNVCYDILDKRIPSNSFATRKKRWIHAGLAYCIEKIKKICFHDQNIYYMKMDISKYFYAIPHKSLKQKIFQYIHNPDLQYVINLVIDSYTSPDIFDELFLETSAYRQTHDKWLPIGALYSQLFANFFLYDIDHFIIQKLKPQTYIRYMDDFIFVGTKNHLISIQQKVIEKVNQNGLIMVPKKIQINKLTHGITMLGYRIKIKDKKVMVRVSSTNKKKYWKCVDAIPKENISWSSNDKARMQSVFSARRWQFLHTPNAYKYLRLSNLSLLILMWMQSRKKEIQIVLAGSQNY